MKYYDKKNYIRWKKVIQIDDNSKKNRWKKQLFLKNQKEVKNEYFRG